jgi:hypothetical protein
VPAITPDQRLNIIERYTDKNKTGITFIVLIFLERKKNMIKFDLDVDIYRSLHDVFAYVVTPENDFHWRYGTLMSAQISDGKIGRSTLIRTIGHFMGRRMESVYEVTEFQQNQKYGFRSKPGSLDLYTLYTFEIINGRTRMGVFVEMDPGDLLIAADSTTENSIKNQYRENLALLKDILETGGREKSSAAMWVVAGDRR